MAYPRNENFSDDQVYLAAAARALGHPGRLALLELLAGRDVCTCGELVHELPLAQATVSQHLKVLREAGLISGTIEGPKSCYCIDNMALNRLRDTLIQWFDDLAVASSCC